MTWTIADGIAAELEAWLQPQRPKPVALRLHPKDLTELLSDAGTPLGVAAPRIRTLVGSLLIAPISFSHARGLANLVIQNGTELVHVPLDLYRTKREYELEQQQLTQVAALEEVRKSLNLLPGECHGNQT